MHKATVLVLYAVMVVTHPVPTTSAPKIYLEPIEDPPSISGEGLVVSVYPHLSDIKQTQSRQDILLASISSHNDLQPISKASTVLNTSIKQTAYTLCTEYFGEGYYNDLDRIINSESGWNIHATEPSTGAYGLGQALPREKMKPYGDDYLDNPSTQLRWLMAYIKDRYGNPSNAWEFHLKNNWY